MTNFEKIKKLSANDLALLICETHMDCSSCRFKYLCEDEEPNASGIYDWLESDRDLIGVPIEASTEERDF